MNIDLSSFSFGCTLKEGAGTPSWGTSFGQSQPAYKFTYNGCIPVLTGMIYCSEPKRFFSMPLGRGGKVVNCQDDDTIQITSIFHHVYVNGIKMNSPFMMVIVREESQSHNGRRSLKYTDKIEYNNDTYHYSNTDFVTEVRNRFGMEESACWFVYAIEIEDFDKLIIKMVIVDSDKTIEYENSSSRKSEWLRLIPNEDKTMGGFETNNSGESCFDKYPLQQIFYGAPGTGKSHKVKEVTETLPKSDVFRTTFHPDSDYSTFVGCYKPKMVKAPIRDGSGHEITTACEDEKKRIAYEYEPQAFLKAYVRAYETNEPVFLVIEEINRGNCAQIFGDMFQLLDRNESGESDYAIKPETAIQEFLNEKLKGCDIADETIKSGEEMRLPANLHIWATMNTSDQSLFPIDSAFKRRWDWKYMPIKYDNNDWKIVLGDMEYSWTAFQKEINKRIYEATNSEDKQMGDWFVRAEANKISESLLLNKIVFYLWNDVCKDGEGDIFNIKTAEDKTETVTFSKFFEGNTTEKLQQWMAFLGIEGSKIDAKIEIDDEDDDDTKNHDSNQPYKVTFPDGKVICKGNSWDTYVASLQKIGLDKAFPFGEQYTRHNKTMPLITKEKIEDQGQYKYQYIDGYYVLSGTGSQHRLLKKINEKLGLGLTIE